MLTEIESYQRLHAAILKRYPSIRGQGHLIPTDVLRQMVAEVRRGGDLWPWVPEDDDWPRMRLVWGLATPPHPSHLH